MTISKKEDEEKEKTSKQNCQTKEYPQIYQSLTNHSRIINNLLNNSARTRKEKYT